MVYVLSVLAGFLSRVSLREIEGGLGIVNFIDDCFSLVELPGWYLERGIPLYPLYLNQR